MTDIYAELRDLSPDQRELMLVMLEKQGVDVGRLPLPKRPSPESAPMSASQIRLWTMDRLSSGLPTENVPVAIELEGVINAEAIARSINLLIERHELLRTTFHEESERLEQRIDEFVPVEVELIDLESQEGQSSETVNAALVEHGSKLFDLETDWLLRPALFRVSKESHILLLTFHQLVVDGWAVNVFLQQLSDAYAEFCADRTPDKDVPGIQYADMAAWQNEGWEDKLIEGQVDYWVKQLRGAPAILELPLGRPRPSVPDFSGALCLFEISAENSNALRELVRQEGVTMFTGVLATLKVLLAAYTGQPDIVVGTLVSRRGRTEAEAMMGNCGNNLLLRTDIAATAPFREILHRVNDVTLDSMAHQDVPLEIVNEKLQADANQRIPAFQIGFIFRDGGAHDRIKIPGVQVRQRFVDLGTARLDLWLDLADHGGPLSGEIQYRTDLLDAQQMDRLMRHWQTAVAELAANPDVPIEQCRLFAKDDGLTLGQAHQIEQMLATHDAIQAARVTVSGPLCDGPANIYFIRRESAEVTGTELRGWLARSLDFDLGPAMFKETDMLPEEASQAAASRVDAGQEPLTGIEARIAEIWSQELGVSFVGPNDNFFDLGGHSLLAVQVLKKLHGLGAAPPDAKSLVTGTLRQLALQMLGELEPTTAKDSTEKSPKRSLWDKISTRLA